MDRVLKRVGLSKRTQSEIKVQEQTASEEKTKIRRRRRSKSRRRSSQESKKTRGLFNIDWESVKDCKSCKSRAITRRFCSKRCDNELYRSNSFKFERFIRGSEEASTLGKKISLCDDYSLPVDNLGNRRRPNSIAVPSFTEWNIASPNEEKGSSEPSSDDEFFGHQHISVTKPQELNSPDSIAEAILPQLSAHSPNRSDIKRHPSPYYYADLYKNKVEESKTCPAKFRKEPVLQPKPSQDVLESNQLSQKIKSSHRKYRKSFSLDNPNLDKPIRARSHSRLKYKKSSSVDTQSTDSRDAPNEAVMPPNRLTSPCACLTPDDGLDDEMTRQRHVYETAFDCRISKSDDDLDQIDKVSNHPVLVQLNNARENRPGPSADSNTPQNRRKVTLLCPKPSQEDNNSVGAISQKLQEMRLPEEASVVSGALSLPLRGYTPSPPSTAPLPTKFPGKELVMNSIRSAPNLPSHPKSRLKDLHLPVKSLRGRSPNSSSGSLQIQRSAFDIEFGNSKLISEFKGRPSQPKEMKEWPLKRHKGTKDNILEFKGRRRRHKYSSTESMTASSSGGSMESIKSSTSEGNRSTTSSDSRQSSSLSSHSSDSGGTKAYCGTQNSSFLAHANKLHILSPISDKSSQEPISETSDNNRNNNSQKCSPEEAATPETMKVKRRLPQNKNLLNLGFHAGDLEIQGSDSGISIQSREGIKSRATSVDLRDLPFDMPKLRRRLRIQPSTESSVSQASSSQSVIEADRQVSSFRPKLTLNLGELDLRQRPGLGLSLVGLGMNLNNPENPPTADVIDVNLPLEKQGWFHGAITRVEAENVLRMLREGSFLVRNSESTKQDYSLSLKSARGFMHMRIQKDGNDECYILGQFSKPFHSIPEMIRHFCINRLPIRGAEHMCLLQPVIAQLL
ncbi:hypothetical protein TcasGA2_TC030888 [Tribolium castaneum]|uniref:SH2 domain-containing adapter protein D n=1 Tax=Tribolium castaneum TaxID=7070 RepID=A0A139WPA0_TRICA|nr:hypothetical protein TcasGA2_TC030888 [Tribolium castaneum]